MPLTIAAQEHHSMGSLTGVTTRITFDSSYLTGGESLVPSDLGLGQILFVGLTQGQDGFTYEWDRSNQTIIAYNSAGFTPAGSNAAPTFTHTLNNVPFFVEEEALTVASDTGTLAFIPAYIVSIADSTGVTYQIIPEAAAEVDNVSCAVNFSTGVITFAGADDPAAVRVTYFPDREGTFFDNQNAVEETLTAATTAVNFSQRAACIQYVYNNTTPGLELIVPKAETPGAAQISIEIDDSSQTSIINNSAEVGDTIAVRYLKHDQLGNEPAITFVGDTDVAFTTQDIDFSSGGLGQGGSASRDKLIVPGFGNVLVGESSGGTTNLNSVWGDSGTTEATNVARWASKINLWASAHSTAFVICTTPQLEIDFTQLVDATISATIGAPAFTGTAVSAAALVEVASGTNLSAAVVDIFVIGR